MPAIAVSAKILTVNSYSDKIVSTALTCFSLIRNNTTPVKEYLPHTSLELSSMFSQKFKEILGYSVFSCPYVCIILFLVLLPCSPQAYACSSRSHSRISVFAKGVAPSFSLLQVTSTGSPSSSLKHCAHASPSCSTPAFQRQSLLQCFPWSSSCSLCQRCFFSITISLKVLQDSLLPAAGWAVHVTQLVPIYYSGEDGRGDEATLGFRGGRLPVLSQASQDWLLPMVVSQVLQALQYAEK